MRSAILLSMEQDNRTEKYQRMHQLLNEKQWRQFLALEAKERGNLLLVVREAGVSRNTIKAGRREIASGELFSPGKRIRGVGGGRKCRRSTMPACRPIWKLYWTPKAIRSSQ
jgi:hypothetical protein